MESPAHPSSSIIKAKVWVHGRKEALQNQHPEWSEAQISTIAEWDYYFSQWRIRFLKNIPFALLSSLGTLTLFKDVIWLEPALATLLAQWSDIAIQAFTFVTLGLFEWVGIQVPEWLVSYLTIGIGMTGIMARTANDTQIIKKSSALGEPMDQLPLTTGCFGCGIWILYAPIMSPLWPALLLIPLSTLGSAAQAQRWSVTKSQAASIQLRRVLTYMEPFVISSTVWLGFALFS